MDILTTFPINALTTYPNIQTVAVMPIPVAEEILIRKLIHWGRTHYSKDYRRRALYEVIMKTCRGTIPLTPDLSALVISFLIEKSYSNKNEESVLAVCGIVELIARHATFEYDFFSYFFHQSTCKRVRKSYQKKSLRTLTSLVAKVNLSPIRIEDTLQLFMNLCHSMDIEIVSTAMHGLFRLAYSNKVKPAFIMKFYLQKVENFQNLKVKKVSLQYIYRSLNLITIPISMVPEILEVLVKEIETDPFSCLGGLQCIISEMKVIPTDAKAMELFEVLFITTQSRNRFVRNIAVETIDSLIELICYDISNIERYLELFMKPVDSDKEQERTRLGKVIDYLMMKINHLSSFR